MFPYIIIFLIASFLFFRNEIPKTALFPYYFFLISLTCFIGLRDMIGGFDVYIYGEIYETKREWLLLYPNFEKGFKFYFLTLRIFNNDRFFMFFITALITVSIHFNIVKKYSPIIFFSLYILFCKFTLMYFIYLRQTLAMCIVWFSIRYIIKRQLMPFIGFVLFAITFHKSAILFMPIYFIYNRKFNNLVIILLAITFLIISVTPISGLLFSSLADVANEEKLGGYLAEDKFSFNSFYLIEVIFIVILMLKYKENFYKEKMSRFIFNGMFVYILVSLLSLTNATFVRFGWYFYIFVIIGMTFVYDYIQDHKQKNVYKLLTFVYFGAMYFRLVILLDAGDYMPYKTIFQDFPRHGKWEFMEYRNR